MIGFNGNTATSAGAWTFDNIMVGDTWADVVPVPEPSTPALAGFAALCLLFCRVRLPRLAYARR